MNYFGLAAFTISLLSYIPYYISIFQHKAKPQRTSWLVFSLISLIFLAAQISGKASISDLAFILAQTIAPIIVLILSIPFGVGGTSRRDKIALIFVAFSLVIWWLLKDPILSLFILIVIDATALSLTIIKMWEQPDSESLLFWAIGPFSSILGLIAIENKSLLNLMFPVYVLLATVVATATLVFAKKQISKRNEALS